MDAEHQGAAGRRRALPTSARTRRSCAIPCARFRAILSIAADAGAALRRAGGGARSARAGPAGARSRSAGRGRASAAAALRKDGGASLAADAPHISPEYLSRCVGEVAGPDGLIFNEYQLRLEHCARTRPGSYFALSPAGGLGWSVGAALGAKLAAPDRFVVATIGDGGMIFANPTACHWAAEAHRAADRDGDLQQRALRRRAQRHDVDVRLRRGGTREWNWAGRPVARARPFERYAEAHGAFAARVEHPAELASTLLAARNAVLKERRARPGERYYPLLKGPWRRGEAGRLWFGRGSPRGRGRVLAPPIEVAIGKQEARHAKDPGGLRLAADLGKRASALTVQEVDKLAGGSTAMPQDRRQGRGILQVQLAPPKQLEKRDRDRRERRPAVPHRACRYWQGRESNIFLGPRIVRPRRLASRRQSI